MSSRLKTLLSSRFGVLFVAFFTAHLLLQFSTWAKAPHDPAAMMLWNILSAPLMYLFGSAASGLLWLSLAICNSILWAALLASVVAGWLNLKTRLGGPAARP